jgi:hypothetical protein
MVFDFVQPLAFDSKACNQVKAGQFLSLILHLSGGLV